jgi:hypothetical protein
MNNPIACPGVGITVLLALVTAGPTVVGLADALPAIVLAAGLAIALLRLVWFITTGESS